MAIKKLKIGSQEFDLQDTTYSASTGLGLSGTAFYLKPASNDIIGGIKEGHDAPVILFDEPYKEKYGVHIVADDNPCAYVGIPYAQTYSSGLMSAEDKTKLDSLHASDFATSGHNHDSRYLKLSGSTMNSYAKVIFPSNANIIQNQDNTSNYTKIVVWLKNSTGWYKNDGTTLYTHQPHIGQHNTGNSYGTITLLPYATDTDPWGGNVGLHIGKTVLKWEDNTIWHAGNDGSGSGLDADLLDGYHAGVNNGQVGIFVPWPSQATLKSEGFLTSSYGTSEYGNPDGEFLQAICKWAINHYTNKGNITLMGAICPNSWGTIIMHLYSDHSKDSTTLLPKYCAALYQTLTGQVYEFGCNNFVWYYRGISAGNANTLDGYHADDILPYGLENICTGAKYSGGQTTLSNGIITTSGIDADTYFQVGLSEVLEQDQIYTMGIYVTGVPSGNTAVWTWPVGGQSNSNWIVPITKNGWNWGTGYCNINGNNLTLMMDDLDRGFYNSIQMSKFVIVKGKQKAYYTPPISKMSVGYATSAGSASASDVYSWAKKSNLSEAINTLSDGTSPSTPEDYIITQYAGGGTTNTSYHRRKLSNVFGALRKSDITTALGYTPPTTNTTYDKASTDTLGLIKVTNVAGTTGNITSTNGTTQGRSYGVQINSDGQAFVNVPWSNDNTTYSASTGLGLSNTAFYLKPASSSTLGGIKTGFRESETKFAVKLDMEDKAYVNLTTASSTGAGLMTAEMVQKLNALESKVDEIIQILNGEYY